MTSNYGDNLTSLYQTKLLLQVSENKKKKGYNTKKLSLI